MEQVFPTFCKNLQCNATFYNCNPSYTSSRTQNELSDKIATADIAKLSFWAKFKTLDLTSRRWNFHLSLSMVAWAKIDYWLVYGQASTPACCITDSRKSSRIGSDDHDMFCAFIQPTINSAFTCASVKFRNVLNSRKTSFFRFIVFPVGSVVK